MSVAESAGKGDELTEQILRLQNEEKEMRANKKRLQADLRNAKRKKSRLTKRAKQLTDSDLFQIMQMREAKKREDPATPSNEDAKEGKAQVSSAARQPSRRGTAVAVGERTLRRRRSRRVEKGRSEKELSDREAVCT